MQLASRTEEADQAIRSLPTGHSRNISDIPLANDKQRARVSQRTSRTSSSAWNAPYSDRATALQTRIEASTSSEDYTPVSGLARDRHY